MDPLQKYIFGKTFSIIDGVKDKNRYIILKEVLAHRLNLLFVFRYIILNSLYETHHGVQALII